MNKGLWRQCGSKHRYRDESEANRMVRKIRDKRGEKLDFYYCVYCKGYHLTSNDKPQPGIEPQTYIRSKDEIIKDKYCIGCAKILSCKGKPRSVKLCVNYEEKRENESRVN